MAKMTFAKARAIIFARLIAEGWTIQSGLKIPHATSPNKQMRLYFKTEAVYVNDDPGELQFQNCHSMWIDIRDYAENNADRFARFVRLLNSPHSPHCSSSQYEPNDGEILTPSIMDALEE